MGKSLKQEVAREEAKRFLEDVVAPNYRTMSDFESWAGKYNGEFGDYLFKVVEYISKRNRGGLSRIFGIGDIEINDILNATISE